MFRISLRCVSIGQRNGFSNTKNVLVLPQKFVPTGANKSEALLFDVFFWVFLCSKNLEFL